MKPHSQESHRQRPPWWHENEDWPPRRWGRRPHPPIFRRMGCLFILPNLFFFLVFTVIAGLVYNAIYQGVTPKTPFFDFILTAGVLILLFMIGMGVLAAGKFRQMVNPLDTLVDASARVADGDYTVRVEEKGPRGVRSLIGGFNSMVERLQASDQQKRSMLA